MSGLLSGFRWGSKGGGGSRVRWAWLPSCAGLAAVVLLIVQSVPARAGMDEFNRWAFELNRVLEDAVLRPAVASYRREVPETAQMWIANAYSNLTEPVTATAHAIDANFSAAAESSARFVVNSTLGVLGTSDAAETLGLPKKEKSFSLAVCQSGLPLGAYVVLPVIGPTTVGIAIAAGTLMVGSTYVLSFVSLQLAVASIAVDVIGSAAALENSVKDAGREPVSYEVQRDRFIETFDLICEPEPRLSVGS